MEVEVVNISRDLEFSRSKDNAQARDAPKKERPFASSRGFNLRETKAEPVSADDLRSRRQETKAKLPADADTMPENAETADTQVLQERAPETERRHTLQQHGNKYQQRFQEAAKAEEQLSVSLEEPRKPSKLAFDADELPMRDQSDRKLTKARLKAQRTSEKLERAEKRLPSYRKLRMETSSDPETGKKERRLKFEKETKPQGVHVKGPAALRPAKGAAGMVAGYAHKKVYQVENENVGIKAAHRTELAGESGIRKVYRLHKTAPYRKASNLQKKAAKTQANAAYRQLLHDNPELKKNALAKLWYKKKLKRQYAKAAREAQKAGKRARKTAVTTEKIAARVVQSIKYHPIVWGIVGLLLLLILIIASVFSSFSSLGSAGAGIITSTSYLAEDRTISNADLIYTEWETDLQVQINRVEAEQTGFDEYRYQIDAIEHDPYVLMGYLTSVYRDFSASQAETALRQLFNSQYSLTFTEETEIRTRTETRTAPETGEEIEVEVEYEWRILNVQLSAVPMENLVVSRMSSEQKEICELLLMTKGNRQYVKNVFGTNWLPYVTSCYGYRIHPISGQKNYHTGVDIGMPQDTDILAGHDGTVSLAGEAGGYGLCIVLDGETNGENALTTKYGHCSQIFVSAGQTVKAGDVIAKVGSTGNSTGPHLHLEVLLDGEYLNPLYFAETGDFTERTLPAVTAGGSYTTYTVPPEALSDARFAAILSEAEKYLGYPYVWGGSSPSTSFDCSGYVSWVINHSGWDVGRLNAEGLRRICAPVTAADAKPGDLIFFQGTYNTTGASHVGIYVGDGMMIHCGNPISYASINTNYWQNHFYMFGRLP